MFAEVTTRYETQVDVRHDGADWVLATTLDAVPTFQTDGAAAGANTSETLQGLIAGLTAAMPELVVAQDETFKALRNLAQHRASLFRELNRMVVESAPRGGAKPPIAEVERVMDAILNPEALMPGAQVAVDGPLVIWPCFAVTGLANVA